MAASPRFAMACFARSGDDNFARALHRRGLLDFYALGTRRGAAGVPPEHTRLCPAFGLMNYIAASALPTFQAESLRFRLFPWFDRWAKSLLRPGQHFLTGYAFAPRSMRWIQEHGGMTFLDAWTSHPEEFWDLLVEEQRRWNSPCPPVSRFYQDLVVESVAAADYIFTSSTFVRNSFLKRGFDPDRLLLCPYAVDLDVFQPAPSPRPRNRPLTIIHTGGLSLRKGAPYLFEAFELIRKEVPDAVLRVKRHFRNDVKPLLRKYAHLPIEWSENVSLPEHVRRYQESDVLLFPSIEDGFALVVAEALACGLPVVTTTNTGASDLIRPGVNGEVVPIRDSAALAEATLKWWHRINAGERIGGHDELRTRLGTERFDQTFLSHLERIGVIPSADPR
jgi:glycosyltransferase involved in cell wall biosynthesis